MTKNKLRCSLSFTCPLAVRALLLLLPVLTAPTSALAQEMISVYLGNVSSYSYDSIQTSYLHFNDSEMHDVKSNSSSSATYTAPQADKSANFNGYSSNDYFSYDTMQGSDGKIRMSKTDSRDYTTYFAVANSTGGLGQQSTWDRLTTYSYTKSDGTVATEQYPEASARQGSYRTENPTVFDGGGEFDYFVCVKDRTVKTTFPNESNPNWQGHDSRTEKGNSYRKAEVILNTAPGFVMPYGQAIMIKYFVDIYDRPVDGGEMTYVGRFLQQRYVGYSNGSAPSFNPGPFYSSLKNSCRIFYFSDFSAKLVKKPNPQNGMFQAASGNTLETIPSFTPYVDVHTGIYMTPTPLTSLTKSTERQDRVYSYLQSYYARTGLKSVQDFFNTELLTYANWLTKNFIELTKEHKWPTSGCRGYTSFAECLAKYTTLPTVGGYVPFASQNPSPSPSPTPSPAP